jgi:uncharacterized membrane protein
MPPYLFALVFGLLAAAQSGLLGFLLGAVIGYCLGAVIGLRAQIAELQRRLEPEQAPAAFVPGEGAVSAAPATDHHPAQPDEAAPAPVGPSAPPPKPPSRLAGVVGVLLDNLRRFFTTGNFVARVGVVVLFFGVAFLLRYAYERDLLPVELRLLGAALLGTTLVIIGWRFRNRSDTFGVVLQGAGVGVLYLTIFGAARLYEVVPVGAAFVLMVVLVAASSMLAVLQNAQSLAIFAMSGGFLAPVLMSTGGGSHVALFSYYALLNAGILAMAWFKFWRWLNWVGFLFTFVIGAAWGFRYYKPEFFATVEPFLILFFLYYLGVTVLFGRRAQPELRGIVDGTLVFGTPIVAFGLQAGMVRDLDFGLAFSALGAAAVYVVLAWFLRRRGAFSALLGQSFLALAIVFATLALPFAFDDQRWTAASWALEGAGLIWVGIRQQQWLPRAFGGVLQLAAGVAFISAEFMASPAPRLVLNSAYFGTLMLALAGGFTAYLCAHHRQQLHRYERWLGWLFMAWSGLWWFAGGAREIDHFQPAWYEPGIAHHVTEHLYLLFAALSVVGITAIARVRDWREARVPGFLLLPFATVLGFYLRLDWRGDSPLADLGFVAWPVALAAIFWHLRCADRLRTLQDIWHAGTWWLTALLIAWIGASLVHGVLPGTVWESVMWGVMPSLVIAVLLSLRRSNAWPFAAHAESYTGLGVLPMAASLLGWVLLTGVKAGDPDPLPYVVLLNPLELAQLGVIFVSLIWLLKLTGPLSAAANGLRAALALVAFAWLNLTAARAVHFYAEAAYPLDTIWQSPVYQATLSILWSVTALVMMAAGARRGLRIAWVAGAALLALVIVKLFTVDLSNLDVVARIISFMTVGLLMLVIGYLAPIPPARRVEAST